MFLISGAAVGGTGVADGSWSTSGVDHKNKASHMLSHTS